MASISMDVVSRTLLEESGPEVIAWLSGQTPVQVELASSEFPETDVKIADRILRAVLPAEAHRPHYFHVELQTAGDPQMGLRMLLYWAKARRRFSRKERRPVEVSSFVIYLDRKQYRDDPGRFQCDDGFGTDCLFHYSVLKLWEMDPASILRLPSPGLAPLLPLMRVGDPVEAVIQSKNKILKAEPRPAPPKRKLDLCGALCAFAGLVIDDRDLISRLIREDWMGLERSVTVQYWLQMGQEKGIEKGVLEASRDDLLKVLECRFGKIEKRLKERISRIQDVRLLRKLLKKAVVASSLKDFSSALKSRPMKE